MGLFSGWQSAVSSAAQIIANLAGQTVSMLKLTLTQVTGEIALQMTTGARLKLGGGTTDYLVSNGATLIQAAGAFDAAGSLSGLSVTGASVSATGANGVQSSLGYFAAGGSNTSARLQGNINNGAAAIGLKLSNFVTLATAGAKVAALYNDNETTEVFAVSRLGHIINANAGDSTGSPGNATLNTPSGRSAIAAGAAAVTITNSLVSATSVVFAVLQTADGTLTTLLRVVPGAGSFTITGNANATGNVNVGWVVFNV